MKGYYKVESNNKRLEAGIIYKCNHPLYKSCTLFTLLDLGLAVIQQRFNKAYRFSWWGPIDPELANDIYRNENFENVFAELSGLPEEGLYPTIEVRKLMYKLKMKPLKMEYWETPFRSQIKQIL